jgi:hypothetical protein
LLGGVPDQRRRIVPPDVLACDQLASAVNRAAAWSPPVASGAASQNRFGSEASTDRQRRPIGHRLHLLDVVEGGLAAEPAARVGEGAGVAAGQEGP